MTTMKFLPAVALLFVLTKGYSQCSGIRKLDNPQKQKTTFYSPRYDSPTDSPVSYMRSDRSGTTQIYLTLTVFGDSAKFDPAEVDSMVLNVEAAFARLVQRDSLNRVSPGQGARRTDTDKIDSMATGIDSAMTKLGWRPMLRDSLMRKNPRKGAVPMAYKGSSLTFSDGTKLAWPTRLVGFKRVNGVGTWSNFIPLTEPQLAQLATGLISEVSVYKHERTLTKEQAEQARQVFNCIRQAK